MRKLSKSRVLSGHQCPKRLYIELHDPGAVDFSPAARHMLEVGNRVGEIARQEFPGGYLIRHQDNLSEALAQTARVLEETPGIPVFEATFSSNDVLIRADILERDEAQNVYLVEVKSSTRVKDYHLLDCAIQAWVIESSGLPVQTIELAHIDTGFVYTCEGDYHGLLKREDITDRVRPLMADLPQKVSDLQQMLQGDEPDVAPGSQCTSPFECPFMARCTEPDSTPWPVTSLPGGGAIVDRLKEEGIKTIADIPAEWLTNPVHLRIREAVVTGQPVIEQELVDVVAGLAWPRYYLDFETVQFAIPQWLGTRPYEQLPFQWSCHIESAPGEIRHAEFLNISGQAPMRPFIDSLLEALGDEGPIIVFSHFEKTVLNKLAERYTDLSEMIARVVERLVDFLPIVRNHYYHPDMGGSFSIKAILPVVAPHLDYKALVEVQDGTGAQMAYLEAIHDGTPPERRAALQQSMLEYCELDTRAMVEMVHYFEQQ